MHDIFSVMSNDELFQWNGSHSDFITFAILATRLSGTDFDDPHFPEMLDATGETLINMINVDIAPYPNFTTMRQTIPPSTDLVLKMMDCLVGQMAFDDAIKSTGIGLSAESESADLVSTMMGYEMARRLSLLNGGENGDQDPRPGR
jgi:hypothetical protein